MLTRYAYNFYSWSYYNDVNNNQNAKRAMIVTADGSTITDGKFMPSILFGNGYASIDSLTLFNSTKKAIRRHYKHTEAQRRYLHVQFPDL